MVHLPKQTAWMAMGSCESANHWLFRIRKPLKPMSMGNGEECKRDECERDEYSRGDRGCDRCACKSYRAVGAVLQGGFGVGCGKGHDHRSNGEPWDPHLGTGPVKLRGDWPRFPHVCSIWWLPSRQPRTRKIQQISTHGSSPAKMIAFRRTCTM